MSELKYFLKENKKKKSNVKYAVTKSLVDENGKPLEWEIRHLSTRENEIIRDECTTQVAINAKKGIYMPKLDTNKYMAKMICKSVVFPNLDSKELQDSYGVMGAEELLKEMIDNPGEYSDLSSFIQEINGFDISLDDKVEEAKN